MKRKSCGVLFSTTSNVGTGTRDLQRCDVAMVVVLAEALADGRQRDKNIPDRARTSVNGEDSIGNVFISLHCVG